VAEAHEGTVEAVSAGGAQFSILLPFSPLQADVQEAGRPAPSAFEEEDRS